MPSKQIVHTSESCRQSIAAVRDTLYVLSGKWKLPIIIALINGPRRFKDLQRQLVDITPKILSKELKELEMNDFVTRTVYDTFPPTVEYARTEHSHTLYSVIGALSEWGTLHRKEIIGN